MGQQIEVTPTVIATSAIFDTDRSLTGQDGETFRPDEQPDAEGPFPEQLAARLFASDGDISTVHVASNVVTVTRDGGWPDGALATAADVVADFFTFYDD